ncbi:MAG TPA: GAG-pre-integrase domain-containing protein, partial [Rhabdochlamydiaceae bacterium]
MTGNKTLLRDFQGSSGPRVTFGDNSTGSTEGYGVFLHGLVKFGKVAYVNGLKHNLISIGQLCDADYKVLFDKVQGTIFNVLGAVVLIAPRRKGVYLMDLSSAPTEKETCFYSKANEEINWLWHKRLSHLNFKYINK